jgi:signal transduction histidine kinase
MVRTSKSGPKRAVKRPKTPKNARKKAIFHKHHDRFLARELLDFLALASHQLRTPLSVIKGYVAMMLEGMFGELTGEQRAIMEKVYNSGERMIRLVNNFLDLPRIHLNMMPLEREPLSLADVLTHAIAESRLQADMKKIPIVWWNDPHGSYKIIGDRENLMQAFTNLLDNAIKYTKTGSVRVSLEKIRNSYLVAIKDTGAGIPAKELQQLFSKFMRGENMRKLYREGRGLGLYISKQIVEGHGGKIWAESHGPGKGSEFYVELPVMPDEHSKS